LAYQPDEQFSSSKTTYFRKIFSNARINAFAEKQTSHGRPSLLTPHLSHIQGSGKRDNQ
jgi:hypothetical protein